MKGTYFSRISSVILHANHVIFGFICHCFFFSSPNHLRSAPGFYEYHHCAHSLAFASSFSLHDLQSHIRTISLFLSLFRSQSQLQMVDFSAAHNFFSFMFTFSVVIRFCMWVCFFLLFHFYDYSCYSIFSCFLLVLRFHLFAIEIFMCDVIFAHLPYVHMVWVFVVFMRSVRFFPYALLCECVGVSFFYFPLVNFPQKYCPCLYIEQIHTCSVR